MSSGVVHDVPVLSPGGDRLGTASVTEGHLEVVFDHMNVSGYIFELLRDGVADGIIVWPRLIAANQEVRKKNTP